MSNQVIVPLDVIDEDELIEFIDRIKNLTHTEVWIERQFVLTSDSPSVLSGLESLFGDVLSKPEYQNPPSKREKTQQKRRRKPKVQKEAVMSEPKKPRGKHVKSWDILSTDQKVSRLELDRMLAEHSIGIGSKLHHPKHGKVTVVLGADDEAPFLLTNEAGDLL